ncbi:MAG: ATP-binding protein [Tepidisphaeraceae bacterium]
MTKLKISKTLALPLDGFITSTQAILAKKGKGKTYKASVQAEELLAAHQQSVAIDPTGAWWGLRSSADGKSVGYPVCIFGGEHGDIELEPTAGEVTADAIATEHFSAVIDLTLFRKNETVRFMTAFLETLYRKNREALHLFIDEADVVAPQRPFGDEARLLGACEDIVRRGRIRGIGCTLISQRPQVLNKNVLSQVDMLTVLGMNHPKDIGAVRDWVEVHGDARQAEKMIEDLPALPQGEAWVWAPATDIFKRITFRDRSTFDSGATPKAGERKAVPKVLAPVDIERLGKTIAATVEKKKANDPAQLKAKIAQLEKQLAAKRNIEINRVALAQLVKDVERVGDRIEQAQQTMTGIQQALKPLVTPQISMTPQIHVERHANGGHTLWVPKPKAPSNASTPRERPTKSDGDLPVGEQATLRALIQFPKGLHRNQLSVLTGYKRSTRDAYIARLREKGLVEAYGAFVSVTEAGKAALPNAEPLPTGEALRDYWYRELPEGERLVLQFLVESYPTSVDRAMLDNETGYKRSTRDAYLSRLVAKQLVLDAGRGRVQASPTLFEDS